MRYVGTFLLGLVVAVSAVAVHRVDLLGLPVGLVLAVLASVGTAWYLRRGDAPRTAATYSLGWVVALGVTLAGRPEGDFALAGDVAGYTLMVVGLVLVVVGVASLPARAPTPGTRPDAT